MNLAIVRKHARLGLLFAVCLFGHAINADALTITPVFTSGPCPVRTPTAAEGVCPDAQSSCPVFHDYTLVPTGYNAVTYCSVVMSESIGIWPEATLYTAPLTPQEQAALLRVASRMEAYVRDDIHLTFEVYKSGALTGVGSPPLALALATEFFTPICLADLDLPPYSKKNPVIAADQFGAYTYQSLNQSYDSFVRALQQKNARNKTHFALIDALPSYSNVAVKWIGEYSGHNWFNGTLAVSNLQAWSLALFEIGSFYFNADLGLPVPVETVGASPGSKPFTVCSSPANFKVLGLDSLFNQKQKKFADYNAPANNPWITVPGTDGSLTTGDYPTQIVHGLPFQSRPSDPTYTPWMLDPTDSAVTDRQLPIAWYQHHNEKRQFSDACSDPDACQYPDGFNFGNDFQGAVEHELRHLLGIMSAEYYRQGYEGNVLGYAYGNALFAFDLFQLDSDSSVASRKDFNKARRNLDVNVPTLSSRIFSAQPNLNDPAFSWIQYGSHDRVFVYPNGQGQYKSFPLMNYWDVGNPDGDVQFSSQRWLQFLPCAFDSTCSFSDDNLVSFTYRFTDPLMLGLPSTYEAHVDQQANSLRGTYGFASERDLEVLSALGYDVDFSYLQGDVSGPHTTKTAKTANWYLACFDQSTGEFRNGVMVNTANHGMQQCVYSVLTDYIDLFN